MWTLHQPSGDVPLRPPPTACIRHNWFASSSSALYYIWAVGVAIVPWSWLRSRLCASAHSELQRIVHTHPLMVSLVSLCVCVCCLSCVMSSSLGPGWAFFYLLSAAFSHVSIYGCALCHNTLSWVCRLHYFRMWSDFEFTTCVKPSMIFKWALYRNTVHGQILKREK